MDIYFRKAHLCLHFLSIAKCIPCEVWRASTKLKKCTENIKKGKQIWVMVFQAQAESHVFRFQVIGAATCVDLSPSHGDSRPRLCCPPSFGAKDKSWHEKKQKRFKSYDDLWLTKHYDHLPRVENTNQIPPIPPKIYGHLCMCAKMILKFQFPVSLPFQGPDVILD